MISGKVTVSFPDGNVALVQKKKSAKCWSHNHTSPKEVNTRPLYRNYYTLDSSIAPYTHYTEETEKKHIKTPAYDVAPPSSLPPFLTSQAGRTGPQHWPRYIWKFPDQSPLQGRRKESIGSWHQGHSAVGSGSLLPEEYPSG